MTAFERGNFMVVRKTKGKLPSLPFVSMKEKILGKKYSVSIIFISPKEALKLNKKSRHKNYIPNALSFNNSKNDGEIYACLDQIRKDAKKFDMNYKKFLPFIIIHSMLHLKGYDHGSKMEKEEMHYMRYFKFKP